MLVTPLPTRAEQRLIDANIESGGVDNGVAGENTGLVEAAHECGIVAQRLQSSAVEVQVTRATPLPDARRGQRTAIQIQETSAAVADGKLAVGDDSSGAGNGHFTAAATFSNHQGACRCWCERTRRP